MRIGVLFGLILLLSGCSGSNSSGGSEPIYADSSQEALDWAGRYIGRLPCADCEAIDTELILQPQGEYRLKMRYIGRSDDWFTETGTFAWDKGGQVIQLQPLEGQGRAFFVGENLLWSLDANGNRIEGALADLYKLQKSAMATDVTAHPWRLTELNGQALAALERPLYILFESAKETGMASADAADTSEALSQSERVYGFSGCNRFFGEVNFSQASSSAGLAKGAVVWAVDFARLGMTRMACEGEPYETPFMEALQETQMLQLSGDALMLLGATGQVLATFTADDSLQP
ncbi:MAG: copper resistance protein NlpE N-terminal domain-containing protein [Hydrogenovibrio sp.]